MNTGSRAAKRWVLGMAAGAAVVGLVLKLTDVRALIGLAPRRTAASAVAPGGQGARSSSSASVDAPGDVAAVAPDGASEPAGERMAAGGTVSGPSRRYDPTELGAGVVAGGGRRAQERAERQAARARARAARHGGSLATGAVEDGAGGSLAAGSAHGAGGSHSVAAGSPAGGSAQVPVPPTDVAFDSGDSQYQTGTQAQIPDIGKLAGAGAGTLSFWMQPGWGEGNQDDASLLTLGDGRLQVIKNVGYLRFEFVDDAGNPAGLGAPIAEWKEGEWHQVTATWNGNMYSLYVDGQLVSQISHDGRVSLPPDASLYVGSNYPENRPVAPGTIGRVDVRNRPLGPGEVAGGYNAATGRTAAHAPTRR